MKLLFAIKLLGTKPDVSCIKIGNMIISQTCLIVNSRTNKKLPDTHRAVCIYVLLDSGYVLAEPLFRDLCDLAVLLHLFECFLDLLAKLV